jgi:peroxiredoxin
VIHNTSFVPALIIAALSTAVGCSPAASTTGGAEVPSGSDDGGSPETVSKGPSAPDFTLPALSGESISLSDYEGDKVVIVDFWSTTCDPCLAEMPELVGLYESKKGEGLEILAISTDGPETRSQVSATVSKLGMSFPILLDEETEVMDRYNPKGALPYTAVVDRSGSIVLKRVGYQPGDESSWTSLVEAVETALAN